MRRRIRLLIASIPLLMLLGFAAAGFATAGGGCHGGEGATTTEASSSVVKIDGCTFAPTVTRVPVGTEVRFLNTSLAGHDIIGRNHEWGTDLLAAGASYSQKFRAAGVYPYSCSLHPGMAGVVIAGSPDIGLAASVQAPPVEPVAPSDAGTSIVPILAAGGLGLLAGALVAGSIVSRRQREV